MKSLILWLTLNMTFLITGCCPCFSKKTLLPVIDYRRRVIGQVALSRDMTCRELRKKIIEIAQISQDDCLRGVSVAIYESSHMCSCPHLGATSFIYQGLNRDIDRTLPPDLILAVCDPRRTLYSFAGVIIK